MLVLPHWDAFQAEKPILTLGRAPTSQIIWKPESSTRPRKPREAPRLIRVYTQEQTTAPFIATAFQVLPSSPVSGSAWERQCSQRCDIQLGGTGGTHEQFQRLGTPRAPPVAAPDSEGLWMLDLGIFLLTISELCNGEVKGMPISFERNRGSERKLFALEDIVATTLERMEPNNTDWSELMTKDPVLTVVHPGCTLCQSHHLALSPCNFFVACCKIHAKLIHLRWWHVPVPNKSSYVTEHKEHVF